jgi:ABC-type lipoprotein export system ATPase subunit
MKIHSQVLHSINIVKLKNLSNVEIDFDGSPLTAIMGVNGCGKSTILYALACVYQPVEEDDRSKNVIANRWRR